VPESWKVSDPCACRSATVPILVPLGVAAALGLADGGAVAPADGLGLLDEA
jgi:hypothetical protein